METLKEAGIIVAAIATALAIFTVGLIACSMPFALAYMVLRAVIE